MTFARDVWKNAANHFQRISVSFFRSKSFQPVTRRGDANQGRPA
jgi:hypothetical protein